MAISTEPERSDISVRNSLWVFVSLVAVTVALTTLYLAMRSVMNIGGACASGGPFIPVRPCPNGIPGLMVGSIWGGIIFAGVYAFQSFKHKGPNFVWLLWPALFLSLGWNFLEFGLNPPGEEKVAVGWLVCAVIFGLMGGLPLIGGLLWKTRRRGGSGSAMTSMVGMVGPLVQSLRTASVRLGQVAQSGVASPPAGPGATAAGSPPVGGDDIVSVLERLSTLRRAGDLTDQEYEAAKRSVLGKGDSG